MTKSNQHPQRPDVPQRLSIGRIIGAHGVRGAVKLRIWTHFPERIPELRHVYLDDEPTPRRLLRAQVLGDIALLQLEGIATRNDAEALRGTVVRIDRSQAAPLGEDEFYHFEILGLRVVDETGQDLGTVVEIIETGANDVYVVQRPDGSELLLPAIRSVILEVDLEHQRMVVRPPQYYGEE
ncbi:MAG: ribosome maturation factor RimM [Thermomicrobium sp.]|nr:ribosome maturation factor RimM [Thermomicrobium sp.]